MNEKDRIIANLTVYLQVRYNGFNERVAKAMLSKWSRAKLRKTAKHLCDYYGMQTLRDVHNTYIQTWIKAGECFDHSKGISPELL